MAVTFMSKYLIQDKIAQKNWAGDCGTSGFAAVFSQFSIIAHAYSNSIAVPDLFSESGTSAYQI